MSIKKSILSRISDWLTSRRKRYPITNEEAAKIIRNFVNGTSTYDYEWDDFTCFIYENPDVNLALQLCWYFEGLYPARHNREYCGAEAFPYFIAVADLLEAGQLHSFANDETLQSFKPKTPKVPEELLQKIQEALTPLNP